MPWQDHYTRDGIIEKIRRLAGEGLSMTQAAEALGHGISRDVVNGLAHRAKISFGNKGKKVRAENKAPAPKKAVKGRTKEQDQKSRAQVAVSVQAPRASRIGFVILEEVDDFAESASVHFNDLRSAGGLQSGVPPRIVDDRCRFPLWPDRMGTKHRPEPFELMHCGKPVLPGTSWCPDCYAKVFTKAEPKPRPKREETGRKAGWQYGY